MFLSRRATQAEYFDLPGRSRAEIIESYTALARVNRVFIFAETFQRLLPKFLGLDHCRSLSLLDLGAGDGSLGNILRDWAAHRGWDWRFTNLDLCVPALCLNPGGSNVAASALALPFRDNTFDVVVASQMTHHLTTDEDVIQHLREAWRVSRGSVFLSDLHRGLFIYSVVWLLLRLRSFPKHFGSDALLSVRRGFRVAEMQSLADRAGLRGARAWLYYGARVILEARKTGRNA